MLSIQQHFHDLLAQYGLLDQFCNLDMKSCALELTSNTEKLELKRKENKITVKHVRCNQETLVFWFTLMPYNKAWRPDRYQVGAESIPIMLTDGGPALSCRGYLDYKAFAKIYAKENNWNNWLKVKDDEITQQSEEGIAQGEGPAGIKSTVGQMSFAF